MVLSLISEGLKYCSEHFVALYFYKIFSSVSLDENKPIWMHAEEREECKVRPLS